MGGPPRPLSELMFEDIGLGGHTLREGDLPRWFTAVPGQAHRFTERIVRNRRCGFFDGWIKLRGAWPADGMLRLALSDHNRLRLHFYHGDRGVTLTYYEDHRHAWAAYSVSRATGDMRPQSPILVATDEERSFRTSPNGLGPIDIAWREGQLLLSRGDVRLLAAPLAGSPDDVYLEGHAGFRGLTMVRVEGVPPLDKPAVAPEHPVTGEFTAAKEIWKTETPTGATWTQHDDGSVELAVAKTKSPAWATWKLPRRDLCEIVMELEEATPGSGVFVADESGQPADVVRFFRDPTSGQTTIGIAPASDARSDQASDPKAGPIPSVSPRPLLRLIVGCGILRCWIGPDGRHWAPAVTTTQSVPAPFATVGLYCKSSESRRSIRLRRIEIRELAGLTGVVGDAVRARAVAIPQANDLADWLKQVDSRLPHDVERDEWRRGCALATLGHGANPRLGTPLLATLLDELLANPRPIESRLAALADAALVVNTWDHHADALSYLAGIARWGSGRLTAANRVPTRSFDWPRCNVPWLRGKARRRPPRRWPDLKFCKRYPTRAGRNWIACAGRLSSGSNRPGMTAEMAWPNGHRAWRQPGFPSAQDNPRRGLRPRCGTHWTNRSAPRCSI